MTTEPQSTQISEGMQLLVARAISDPQWRQQLIDNPQQALDRAAFPLSDEERRVITSTTREDREQMMTQLSERQSPAVCTWWTLAWTFPCSGWFSRILA